MFFPYTGLPNPFRTTGVENIEKRYSSGGGSKNHLPATATKRGDHDHVEGNTETAKGIGSPHHQEHFGGQKPDVSGFFHLFCCQGRVGIGGLKLR